MATNPASSEVDSLAAILLEDFHELDVKGDNEGMVASFDATVFPTDDLNECHCSVTINVKIPPKYPAVAPVVCIKSCDGISASTSSKLLHAINSKLSRMVSNPDVNDQEMLYPIIELVKEFLQDYNFIGADADDWNDALPEAAEAAGAAGAANAAEDAFDVEEDEFGGGDDWDDTGDADGGWSDTELTNEDPSLARLTNIASRSELVKTDAELAEDLAREKEKNKPHNSQFEFIRKNKDSYADMSPKQLLNKLKRSRLNLTDIVLNESNANSSDFMLAADMLQLLQRRNNYEMEQKMDEKVIYVDCQKLDVLDGDTMHILRKYLKYDENEINNMYYEVSIGLKLSHFLKNKALASVIGFFEDEYLVIRMWLSKYYMSDSTPPKVIVIGKTEPWKRQTKPQNSKNSQNKNKHDDESKSREEERFHQEPLKLHKKLRPFIGCQSLLNRLTNKFFARYWPPNQRIVKARAKHYVHSIRLMAITRYDYHICSNAMNHFNSFDSALLYLTNFDPANASNASNASNPCNASDADNNVSDFLDAPNTPDAPEGQETAPSTALDADDENVATPRRSRRRSDNKAYEKVFGATSKMGKFDDTWQRVLNLCDEFVRFAQSEHMIKMTQHNKKPLRDVPNDGMDAKEAKSEKKPEQSAKNTKDAKESNKAKNAIAAASNANDASGANESKTSGNDANATAATEGEHGSEDDDDELEEQLEGVIDIKHVNKEFAQLLDAVEDLAQHQEQQEQQQKGQLEKKKKKKKRSLFSQTEMFLYLHDVQHNLRRIESFLFETSSFFETNVLAQLLFFMLHSNLTLSQRCLVCDNEFALSSLASSDASDTRETGKNKGSKYMIKPTVCNNYLCLFTFEELEVGFDVTSHLLHTPVIVDLLITFAYVACKKRFGRRLSNAIKLYFPFSVSAIHPKTGKLESFVANRRESGIKKVQKYEKEKMLSQMTPEERAEQKRLQKEKKEAKRHAKRERADEMSRRNPSAFYAGDAGKAFGGPNRRHGIFSDPYFGNAIICALSDYNHPYGAVLGRFNYKYWDAQYRDWHYSRRTYRNGYEHYDYGKLEQVIGQLPSVDTMIAWAKQGGDKHLQSKLNSKSVLLFPLLKWIITSNRSYICELKGRYKFKTVPSSHQFKFVTASPEKERNFQLLVKRAEAYRGAGEGSVWAWHGSPLPNWHAIVRNGLKNMSRTKHMANGAAFGNGVYMAPDSGTSYWYCDASHTDSWPLSTLNRDNYYGRGHNPGARGHGIYCLALCEVVNHEKLKSPEPFYVVPSESWIITRYLFVFNTTTMKKKNDIGGKGIYFDLKAETIMKHYCNRLEKEGLQEL